MASKPEHGSCLKETCVVLIGADVNRFSEEGIGRELEAVEDLG